MVEAQQVQGQDPLIRVVIGPRRSGTTMLMDLLSSHSDCAVTSRVISKSKGIGPRSLEPDYSIFSDKNHPLLQETSRRGAKYLIVKDETGDSLTRGDADTNECTIRFFPSAESIRISRPAFILRDPLRTFDSWSKVGWHDVQAFCTAYTNVWQHILQVRAVLGECCVLRYEDLVGSRESRRHELKKLCGYWDLPFEERIIDLQGTFGDRFLYHSARESEIHRENPKGLFTTLRNERVVREDLPSHGLVAESARQVVEERARPVYQTLAREQMPSGTATTSFSRRQCIFFDIDGTLVDHRSAQRQALEHILAQMDCSDFLQLPDGQQRWNKLSEETMARYLRGDCSFEQQREERIRRYFTSFGRSVSERKSQELSTEFVRVYEEAIKPFPGAEELCRILSALCPLGIISNGEFHQQARKLGAAGLLGYFSSLVVPEHAGAPKPNGKIFEHAMSLMNHDTRSFMYVGDSVATDIAGSTAAGWDSLLVDWSPTHNQGAAAIHTPEELLFQLQRWILRRRIDDENHVSTGSSI